MYLKSERLYYEMCYQSVNKDFLFENNMRDIQVDVSPFNSENNLSSQLAGVSSNLSI